MAVRNSFLRGFAWCSPPPCSCAGMAAAQSAPLRPPNENGRIPILEYHLVTDHDSRWGRSAEHFRRDLKLLYDRGYRPITVSQLVDKQIDIPAGMSPVVFTFDDASPGQFSYIERNGQLEIDPNSAVGIWLGVQSRASRLGQARDLLHAAGGRGGACVLWRERHRRTAERVAPEEGPLSRRAGVRAVRPHALAREPGEVQRRGGAGADRARRDGDRFGGAGLPGADLRAAARDLAEESRARAERHVARSQERARHPVLVRRDPRGVGAERAEPVYGARSSRTACRVCRWWTTSCEKELDRLDASGQRFVAGARREESCGSARPSSHSAGRSAPDHIGGSWPGSTVVGSSRPVAPDRRRSQVRARRSPHAGCRVQ